MSSNTINSIYGCAFSSPGRSSKPAGPSMPKTQVFSNVLSQPQGGARGQEWQHYNRDTATTSHQADLSIGENAQSLGKEWSPTPCLPGRGRASNPRPQEPSPFIQKARSYFPRKIIGKRSASIAGMRERLTPSKRIRSEEPEDAHTILVLPSAPFSSSHGASDANGVVTGKDVAVTVPAPFDAHVSTNAYCLSDPSAAEWNVWLTEDPVGSPRASSDETCGTEQQVPEYDIEDMDTFMDILWKGTQKAKESPNTSSSMKSTIRCDPLKKDHEHAVPAAAWYAWSDLYNEVVGPNQGFEDEEDEGCKGPVPTGSFEVGGVLRGRDVVVRGTFPREEDAGFEFPATRLAIPDVATNTITTSQSTSTPVLTPPLAPPHVHLNAPQLTDSSTKAQIASSEAPAQDTTPVSPSRTELDVSSLLTNNDPPTAGATPHGAFRYSAATEAKIWGLASKAEFTSAYRLFHPSERAEIIEGDDVTRFLDEHRDKVTKAARNKATLWVCQATAKWSKEDGTVSYMPEPCKVASASSSIFAKHIATKHLGKVLKSYAKKPTCDAEEPGK